MRLSGRRVPRIRVHLVLIVRWQLRRWETLASAAYEHDDYGDGKKCDPFHVVRTVAVAAGLPSLELAGSRKRIEPSTVIVPFPLFVIAPEPVMIVDETNKSFAAERHRLHSRKRPAKNRDVIRRPRRERPGQNVIKINDGCT